MGNLYNPDVRYSFNIPMEEKSDLFTWDPYGPWQDCTKMCQGTLVLNERDKSSALHAGIIWSALESDCLWNPRMYTTQTYRGFLSFFLFLLFSPLILWFLYLTASLISTLFNVLHHCFFPITSSFSFSPSQKGSLTGTLFPSEIPTLLSFPLNTLSQPPISLF